ncbi:MAG: hypothetical protein DRI80_06645 [Chloroflexota bacterium]|nr:MAG: hypothetical protein DRI80_06645 [Chloroflexota bacterium]
MNIRELVNSMLTIEERLRPFEGRYGLKSAEFYRLVKSGQLGELDGREDTSDLLEWLGLYELWLDCKSEYDKLVQTTPRHMLVSAPATG